MARRASSSEGPGPGGGSAAEPRRSAQRGARRVERDVAAAHHHDALPQIDPEALVHVEQVLDRTEDAVELVTRQIEAASTAGADGEEERGVPIEELGEARVGTDAKAGTRVDAEFEDRADLTLDHASRESVLGYPEDHHPAEARVGLVHGDRMTGEAKIVRGRQTGGSTADHADRRAGRGWHRAVPLVPDGGGSEALDPEPLGDEALERTDRDRCVDRATPARGLAGRGTDATTDRCERIRGPCDQVGVSVAALRNRGDVATRVGVHRARRAAGLVVPQPLRVGHTWFAVHQITRRACSRRNTHANATNTTMNPVVTMATRPFRESPVKCVSSQLGTNTRSTAPATRMTTADRMARPQPIVPLVVASPGTRGHQVTVNAARMPMP